MKKSQAVEIIKDYLRKNSIHEIGPYEIFELIEMIGLRPPYDTNQDDETDTFEWEPEEDNYCGAV